ncbi:hypothetical protein DPMN_178885 [Dreissena polymorpha]|uniref:Uncharacterized protein n=1 Tax=Dreissena polymorpha TaxID=45954 RepID=A0A9D4ILV0_DREPO|nr:hypothetical protein DPMN_178885 [Dreissena polymorpha]
MDRHGSPGSPRMKIWDEPFGFKHFFERRRSSKDYHPSFATVSARSNTDTSGSTESTRSIKDQHGRYTDSRINTASSRTIPNLHDNNTDQHDGDANLTRSTFDRKN